eukprot:1178603-Prorocentrum_minimum.AAC.1
MVCCGLVTLTSGQLCRRGLRMGLLGLIRRDRKIACALDTSLPCNMINDGVILIAERISNMPMCTPMWN